MGGHVRTLATGVYPLSESIISQEFANIFFSFNKEIFTMSLYIIEGYIY